MNRFTPIVSAVRGPGGGTAPRRYWAFLSYAHADAKTAARLHLKLEGYKVPVALVGHEHPLGTIPARLAPVFRDRQELAASSDLGREIKEALEASSYLVVLCSPAAAKSRWVDQEIRDFKQMHGEERVLAAILDGEPFATDPERECFPPAMRRRVGPDGELTDEAAEPIAADLREDGDGWRGGFLKLVAGMLDVGLDDLVQRDQQRRQKRMAWIAAASLIGMIFTSGLSVVALNARDAAREERREAEGLVEFMLGDLKGKLEPIGKLDALDGVGTRILAYYSRQDAADLDDAGLMQRSRALSLTAQVAYQREDFDTAERLYRQALAGTQEAIDRSPGDAQRLFDHAQNVFWIGELARFRGQLEQAEAAYREYQRLAEAMVAIDPANLTWRMETVYAGQLVGIVAWNKRRFADAASQFEAALGPVDLMASTNPANDQYQAELSTMLAWLADARRDQGRLQEAIDLRERQIALLEGRLSKGSSNVTLQEHLIPARQALGILLAGQGRDARAAEVLRLAVADAESLIPVEPDNGRWRRFAAGARLELGSTMISLDRLTAARLETDAGCKLVDEDRSRHPTVASWREFLTNCRMNRARLALAEGDLTAALALAGRALDSARAERSVDRFKPRYRIAAAHRLIGDVHRRLGNHEAARRVWQTGLEQLPANVSERPREIEERLELLKRLARTEEARLLANRLAQRGYRSER